MKLAIIATIGFGLIAFLETPPEDHDTSMGIIEARAAGSCFKTGEKTSGMNKICYYDCYGSEAAITIASHKLCPLTIDR